MCVRYTEITGGYRSVEHLNIERNKQLKLMNVAAVSGKFGPFFVEQQPRVLSSARNRIQVRTFGQTTVASAIVRVGDIATIEMVTIW